MGDSYSTLIFAAVALLAWAIKAAVERKEAQRRRQGPSPSGDPGALPDSGELDVIVGRMPIPDAVAPKPRIAASRESPYAAQAAEQSAPTVSKRPTRSRRRRGRRGRRLGTLRPTVDAEDVGGLEDRRLTPEVRAGLTLQGAPAPSPGDAPRSSAGAGPALRKLGVEAAGEPSDMLRVGVLWSEVLGVPRALAGPHRSPAAKRMAARRR